MKDVTKDQIVKQHIHKQLLFEYVYKLVLQFTVNLDRSNFRLLIVGISIRN